jgi:hypothetical protein
MVKSYRYQDIQPSLSIQGFFFKSRVQLWSPRSSPESCFMKTTNWVIITSFLKFHFSGLKNIFRLHLQLQLEACWGDVIMTSSWQLEVKITSKIILRLENESTWRKYEIWSLGRLHTSRFSWDMRVQVWAYTCHWYSKNYGKHWCFRACSLCSHILYWDFPPTKKA